MYDTFGWVNKTDSNLFWPPDLGSDATIRLMRIGNPAERRVTEMFRSLSKLSNTDTKIFSGIARDSVRDETRQIKISSKDVQVSTCKNSFF